MQNRYVILEVLQFHIPIYCNLWNGYYVVFCLFFYLALFFSYFLYISYVYLGINFLFHPYYQLRQTHLEVALWMMDVQKKIYLYIFFKFYVDAFHYKITPVILELINYVQIATICHLVIFFHFAIYIAEKKT